MIPYAELKEMGGESGLEMHKKEAYLSDADFQEVFKMTRDEFEKMALWKKNNAKKSVGLF